MLFHFVIKYADDNGTHESKACGIVYGHTLGKAAASVVDYYCFGEEDVVSLTIEPMDDIIELPEEFLI